MGKDARSVGNGLEEKVGMNMSEKQQNTFLYVIENFDKSIIHTLPVDAGDVIQNADGQVDCPLDRVLRKNKLEIKDLFEMKANQAKFILQSEARETVLQSISFQHLVFQP